MKIYLNNIFFIFLNNIFFYFFKFIFGIKTIKKQKKKNLNPKHFYPLNFYVYFEKFDDIAAKKWL
jgi:hypothetical protein